MRYEEKVPNGKLVCFSVEVKNNKVSDVKLTGDFFLHPEDTIEALESSLIGLPIETSESEITLKIQETLKGSQLIGATAEDLARIFRKTVLQ